MRRLNGFFTAVGICTVCLLAADPDVGVAAVSQDDGAAIGRQIADALNQQDADRLMQLVDLQAFQDRVGQDLGLNESQAQGFREGLGRGLRRSTEGGMRAFVQRKGVARFLRTGKRIGKPFTMIRIEYGSEGGFDYVEYYLTPALKIEDWYSYGRGNRASSAVRLAVSAMVDKDSMLSALFGIKQLDHSEVEKFQELSRQLNAGDYARAYRVLEGLPESYKQTKDWAMLRANLAMSDEAAYRASLEHLAKNFGTDHSVQFMLIDYYYYQQRFEQAYQALTAFEGYIGGEDAATSFLKCSVLMGWKRVDDAAKACQRAMSLEPDFKSGYWGLVTVGLQSGNPGLALSALSAYEKAFNVEFDPNELAKLDAYRDLSKTAEFSAWAKKRRIAKK
jgi:tetratricopeptide (TPR) repeat protein